MTARGYRTKVFPVINEKHQAEQPAALSEQRAARQSRWREVRRVREAAVMDVSYGHLTLPWWRSSCAGLGQVSSVGQCIGRK